MNAVFCPSRERFWQRINDSYSFIRFATGNFSGPEPWEGRDGEIRALYDAHEQICKKFALHKRGCIVCRKLDGTK